ncbi:helix-turn-helix domain-containing protein [Acetobacterium woodii]|nr:helix-turn-helix transcriptional regulator [Acetobacterium woodii]
MENKIKQLRITSGLTQRELSERAGINIRQIQKYEVGDPEIGKVSLKISVALADALGVKDLRELLNKSDNV